MKPDSSRDIFRRFSTWRFNRIEAFEISETNFRLLSSEILSLRILSEAPMIVEIGVRNSWEREFISVLYNFTAFAFFSS
jgi:hypothetical protein